MTFRKSLELSEPMLCSSENANHIPDTWSGCEGPTGDQCERGRQAGRAVGQAAAGGAISAAHCLIHPSSIWMSRPRGEGSGQPSGLALGRGWEFRPPAFRCDQLI